MHHEETGCGTPIVLVHAGIADSRMWEPQWTSFAARHRLIRLDLAGFGRTPIESMPIAHAHDVVALLDELGTGECALVGCSMGGRVALEVALARPEQVRALVLVDSGLPGAATSEAIRAYGAAEEEAVERGDLHGAVELNLRMWVDGPHREPGDVDPAVRAAVGEMTRRSIELVLPFWDSFDEELLVPDVADRLADVRARTLVVLGELDVDDFHTIARRLAESIPGARLETIPGTAHLPSLERPDLFDPLVLDFLADALS